MTELVPQDLITHVQFKLSDINFWTVVGNKNLSFIYRIRNGKSRTRENKRRMKITKLNSSCFFEPLYL